MHGAPVYLGCSRGRLNQVWYFYNVQGNAIDGSYKAVETRKLMFVGGLLDFSNIFI